VTALPDHLTGLNEPQRKAVETLDGPLLILAGAGSGKTRVLTRRIAHLLHNGVKPWRILAVTFTNKAASEMKARIIELVGEEAGKSLWVSTFHSSCARILRQEAEHIGLSRNYVVWDDDDQIRVIKQISKDLNLDPKQHPPRGFRSKIDGAKNKLWGPDEYVQEGGAPAGGTVDRVFRAYEQRLAASHAIDFNDIINHVVKLFRTRPDRLERWQDKFLYLLVDEYQDTNRAQYELVKALSAKRRNLAVVGDDDQSIYSFRGADIRNILDFEDDFPDATVVRLEQNYRSSQKILAAAMAVVKNNRARKDKTLWSDGAQGEPIKLLVAHDEMEQAALVANDMATQIRNGRSYGDLAVIYRTNASSRPLEQVFGRRNWQYVVVGARRFYQRREVRDVLAYVRLVLNPADDMAFARIINVPRRGIGAKALASLRADATQHGTSMLDAARGQSTGTSRKARSLADFTGKIQEWQQKALGQPPAQLVSSIAQESGYVGLLQNEDTDEARDRLLNIDALIQDAGEEPEVPDNDSPLAQLQAWLDRASLAGQSDELPEEGGSITLLTSHLAKGLEFPVVYVVGMVEGSFPHVRSANRIQDIEEERRLAYVAFTRAEERLVLCRSREIRVFGETKKVQRSRFLDEIPDSLTSGGGRLASFYGKRKVAARPGATRADGADGTVPDTAKQRMEAFLTAHGKGKAAKAPLSEGTTTYEPNDISAFETGTRVLHPTFGHGTVRQVTGTPSNTRITVHFQRHGRMTLSARHANLQVVVG
jgi:DNA helicase II / ATP-dependent DNA helicase PcrA